MKAYNLANNQIVVDTGKERLFFSNEKLIAKKKNGYISIDEVYWKNNPTTLRYLKIFLNITMTKAEIAACTRHTFENLQE